ncbi:hypothetical protein DIPPA_23818 [Diplonema papillatum]|nr:hypothetical protein DIPPA_23818 [Diplonema papillatum]
MAAPAPAAAVQNVPHVPAATASEGSQRPVSPLSPGMAKEIRDRMKLLQRTLEESASPTNFSQSFGERDRKLLEGMVRDLELADHWREQKVVQHRQDVLDRALELRADRESQLVSLQEKKEQETRQQLQRVRLEVAEDLREAARRWFEKHENSRKKLYEDRVREEERAREQNDKRRRKIEAIEQARAADMHERWLRNEKRRKAAVDRLERLENRNKSREDERDQQREVRGVELSKRAANAEKERQNKRKKAENSRREARERHDEATAFEVASEGFLNRERQRSTKIKENELKKTDDLQQRKQANLARRERADTLLNAKVESMEKSYEEIEKKSKAKDSHVETIRALRKRQLREKREREEAIADEHRKDQGKLMEQRLHEMENRWSRRADRCIRLFASEGDRFDLGSSSHSHPIPPRSA